jgi:hypothetical protein
MVTIQEIQERTYPQPKFGTLFGIIGKTDLPCENSSK